MVVVPPIVEADHIKYFPLPWLPHCSQKMKLENPNVESCLIHTDPVQTPTRPPPLLAVRYGIHPVTVCVGSFGGHITSHDDATLDPRQVSRTHPVAWFGSARDSIQSFKLLRRIQK